MTDWRKTKCCGTCALFPIEAATRNGRIYRDSGGGCQWRSTETYPSSVRAILGDRRPMPGYVRVEDGTDCACHRPREGHRRRDV